MKKLYTNKGRVMLALVFGLTTTTTRAQLTENFDVITTLTGAGWFMQNNSAPLGSTDWFQGNPTAFPAFNGATDSYIGANFNNTAGTGNISNWLVTPNFTIKNGDVITFYTRTSSDNMWADRLQVRMSTNGASTNVGTGATGVGDFTTVLLDINPTLALSVYPLVWTQFTVTVSGLSSPMSGRFAFRYFVTNGGPTGANSDYIGIDNFVYTPYVCPTLTVTPGSLPAGTAGIVYSQPLSQTGGLGSVSYAVTGGALPPGLTLSTAGVVSGTPSATGTYNFTVTVTDASGCTGSSAVSITIGCPTGGASLSSFPSLCSNGTPYTLVQGSPAGGTYSGAGVTGSTFDPSFGTQNITYTLVDVYGCTQAASANITVNAPPSVTFSSLTDVCDNAASFALTGGFPAGGSYSGTGVTSGNFNPAAGTQTITYTYTDGNGCSNTATQTQTVLTSPTVTLSPFTPSCLNAAPVTLSGGSPAGGVYSGTGVSAGMFNPSSGSQTVTYIYTAPNGCIGTASQLFTVNPEPSVSLSSFSSVCEGSSPFTLTGGSPAGGTYTGPGVSGGMFNPSAQGTFTITYTFTDGNGCTGSDFEQITVVDCSGMAELSGLTDFECYPNPVENMFTVSFNKAQAGWLHVRMVSADGKVVLNENNENVAGAYTRVFNVEHIPAGVYMLYFSTSNGTYVHRIVNK